MVYNTMAMAQKVNIEMDEHLTVEQIASVTREAEDYERDGKAYTIEQVIKMFGAKNVAKRV